MSIYQKNIGERLKSFRKFKKIKIVPFSKLLGISHGSLSGLENNKSKPSAETLMNLCRNTDINIQWLLTGEGEMIRQGAENDTSIGKAGSPLGADPEVVDFLKMTRAVLESGTAYSDTLIANIRLSYHAMETENRLKGVEERLGKIEKDKSCQEKPPRIREGDNEAERDEILKKRVACGC